MQATWKRHGGVMEVSRRGHGGDMELVWRGHAGNVEATWMGLEVVSKVISVKHRRDCLVATS